MLQIARARDGDAGRYACVAVNEAGQDSIHYDVRVLCELPFSSECQKGLLCKITSHCSPGVPSGFNVYL